ncbi:hypothetical protein CUMW_229000 [Citrus unshiu]|uniref:Uncharacterized protein n=1 Tax=Citrus unshiu TaxID=55188 RepID=A0A2H5QGU2_CITUN|nr:hypothetical protein CUMW_229000 [Citrus unshiu]
MGWCLSFVCNITYQRSHLNKGISSLTQSALAMKSSRPRMMNSTAYLKLFKSKLESVPKAICKEYGEGCCSLREKESQIQPSHKLSGGDR